MILRKAFSFFLEDHSSIKMTFTLEQYLILCYCFSHLNRLSCSYTANVKFNNDRRYKLYEHGREFALPISDS